MLGDHGYFRKCEPYEGSANIPFVIGGSPELGFKPGLHVKQPVCLEDIMPTLLALAGTRISGHVDGINLVPLLRGQNDVIRKWLHFEHASCYSDEQAYHALTDGHYKYIWRPSNGREHLFDLDEDPHEERDLSGRPEGFSENDNLITGRPYLPLNSGTLTHC